MIIAKYDKNGDTHNLFVGGHAKYAEKGQDIVCAGVSSLVYALIAWLENNSDCTQFVSIDEDNGEVVIACDGNETVSAVFYMAAIGIEQIMHTYPDHVDIDIVGVDD